jgi:predicted dehydrogenase
MDDLFTAEQPALRGLIVGLGAMGANHLRILTSLPGVEVVAAVERDAERRHAMLRMQPGIAGYGSLEEAFAAHDLDFACLAVPVGALPPCAAAVLDAGLHAFVEKPMAPSEEQAREMIAMAADRDLVLGVGYVERFNPAVVALKCKLEAGMVGRIVQMHARRLSPFPNRDGMAGVALDLATHDIDIMRFLSGSEVERVYAESFARPDEVGEDLLSATLRFESGSTGLLEVNWITPTKVRELSVLGEGGMFVVNYLTQDLLFYEHPTRSIDWDQLSGMRGGREGDMVRYALDRREPLRVQWEAFADAVRHGSSATVRGSDGLAALSTARAIQAAGREHRVITPDYREATIV